MSTGIGRPRGGRSAPRFGQSQHRRHEALRLIRRGNRERPVDEPDLFEEPSGEPLDRHLLQGERDRMLWRTFGTLSDRCTELIRLLISDHEPSYGEISAALDMPIGTIGPTRRRCLERLRRTSELAELQDLGTTMADDTGGGDRDQQLRQELTCWPGSTRFPRAIRDSSCQRSRRQSGQEDAASVIADKRLRPQLRERGGGRGPRSLAHCPATAVPPALVAGSPLPASIGRSRQEERLALVRPLTLASVTEVGKSITRTSGRGGAARA